MYMPLDCNGTDLGFQQVSLAAYLFHLLMLLVFGRVSKHPHTISLNLVASTASQLHRLFFLLLLMSILSSELFLVDLVQELMCKAFIRH